MRAVAPIIAFASVCLLPLPGRAQDLNGFEARTLQGSKGLTLPYRLFKVKNPTAGTKYPLILFLHGAGERGDNNTSQLMANAGATVWATDAHQAEHPAYIIAPQCPAGKQWVDTDWTLGSYSTTTVPVSDQLTTALEIADAVATEFGTDPARQYITGLSMGGYGTWDAVIRNPTRFAAALPVCGAGDPSKADLIKLLPLWTFHGDADATVPVKGSRDMVAALKAVGSTVQYSEYPGIGHDAWTTTYANEAVIDWLFENKRPSAAGGAGGMGGAAGSAGAGGGVGGSGNGGSSAGQAAGGAAGASATAGSNSGGAAGAPSSSGGATAGNSNVAGSTFGDPSLADTSSDDSGCAVSSPGAGDTKTGGALMLGGFALLLLKRRRAAA
ncbi:MAG TPA: prolyl oligopeptidase family serine peptidase [Polyangiaceae bacterium]|nr:prolyl oligopeptidase family serine peptidase [Polyangiaceae bacterium]